MKWSNYGQTVCDDLSKIIVFNDCHAWDLKLILPDDLIEHFEN